MGGEGGGVTWRVNGKLSKPTALAMSSSASACVYNVQRWFA
jgi:hypothetical protein